MASFTPTLRVTNKMFDHTLTFRHRESVFVRLLESRGFIFLFLVETFKPETDVG